MKIAVMMRPMTMTSGFESYVIGLVAGNETNAFLVIGNDRIVYERYADGFSRWTPHDTASLAKSLVRGLSLMLAMNDECARPDDLASKFVPDWSGIPRKSDITLRHLATHTSGVEDAEADRLPHDRLAGWKSASPRRSVNLDHFAHFRELRAANDGVKIGNAHQGWRKEVVALGHTAEISIQPGSRWLYRLVAWRAG